MSGTTAGEDRQGATDGDAGQAPPPAADEVMARVMAAVEAGRSGERAAARAALDAVWAQLGDDGDPFHRCVLAHYQADLQDDPVDELAWDRRALEAAGDLTDERAGAYHSTLQVRGFLPSLHLNLADDHRRLGDEAAAREHLALARGALDALPEDGYRATIEAGLGHVADALAAGSTAALATHHGPA